MLTYNLTNAQGDEIIPKTYPRGGGSPWGTVTVYNGEDANGDAQFVMDYQLAFDWLIEEVTYYYNVGGNLKLTPKGEPEINNNFVVAPVNPLVNATQIRVAQSGLGDQNVVVARLKVGQIDFFNPGKGLIPSSVNYIYVWNAAFTGGRPNAGYFELPYTTIQCN